MISKISTKRITPKIEKREGREGEPAVRPPVKIAVWIEQSSFSCQEVRMSRGETVKSHEIPRARLFLLEAGITGT
jgi:hypothetical protein